MTDTFLSDFHRVVTHGADDTVQCRTRDRAVRGTPEERVRPRVVDWRIHDKGWRKGNVRLEKGDARVSEPARTRIRPDVELPDDGDVLVVVECTRCDVPHGGRVGRQAVKDALGQARSATTPHSGRKGDPLHGQAPHLRGESACG